MTTFITPNGRTMFFHKETSEAWWGKKFTREDGWNGQVRCAKLQAEQALQLSMEAGEEGVSRGRGPKVVGVNPDEDIFKILSPHERKFLPKKNDLHVCVVSARRATTVAGVRDIFMVQKQFDEAGVTPKWYVDEASVKDYRRLGLNAVVGGKLCPSRNAALRDARRMGKVCVQVSDDISCWYYRHGRNAKVKGDINALNAAHDKAKRLILSPVAAARFIVAKMRGCESPKPKLGGIYMLSSCSRTFSGDAFSRKHFCIGDFFVVEPSSTVKFDENMKLKEDYDFSAAHVRKYGSVMRCNRMTILAKHYSNSGGAVSNRDSKEEKRNISILFEKWPNCFKLNKKRKNEVLFRWRKSEDEGAEEESDQGDIEDDCEDIPRRTEKSKKLGIRRGDDRRARKTVAKKVRSRSVATRRSQRGKGRP